MKPVKIILSVYLITYIHTYIIMSYHISVVPPRYRNGTVSDLEEYLNTIRNKIEGSPFSHNGELCVLTSESPLASRSSALSGSAFSGSAAYPSRSAVDPWRSAAYPSLRGGKSRARKGYNKYMKKTRKRN